MGDKSIILLPTQRGTAKPNLDIASGQREMSLNPLARTRVLSQVAFGRSHGLNNSSAFRFATPVS